MFQTLEIFANLDGDISRQQGIRMCGAITLNEQHDLRSGGDGCIVIKELVLLFVWYKIEVDAYRDGEATCHLQYMIYPLNLWRSER